MSVIQQAMNGMIAIMLAKFALNDVPHYLFSETIHRTVRVIPPFKPHKHPAEPIARAVIVPGGSRWRCVKCGVMLEAGEEAVKVGGKVYCVECARGGNPGSELFQQYCSKCGGTVGQDEIIYPDLPKWARERREAEAESLPLPEFPGPAVTVCCGALLLYPPTPELETPPLELGATRIEGVNFSAMIKLCNRIGKSPRSIKAYLRLDVIPNLFGPRAYFIDIKAKGTAEEAARVLEELGEEERLLR